MAWSIQEMHYQVRLAADKVASFSSDNLNPAQLDWYLNMAQDLEVDARLGINNINRQGLEVTQKRADDLKQIHVISPSTLQPALVPTIAGDFYGDYYEVPLSTLEFYYVQLTGLRCKIAKTGCAEKVIGLTQARQDELDFLLTDPNYGPDYKWGKGYFTIGSAQSSNALGSIYIYTSDQFTITEVYPTYYRRPNRVFIGGYDSLDGVYLAADPAVNLELDRIEKQICQRAVELIMADIQDVELAQLASIKQTKNEF